MKTFLIQIEVVAPNTVAALGVQHELWSQMDSVTDQLKRRPENERVGFILRQSRMKEVEAGVPRGT